MEIEEASSGISIGFPLGLALLVAFLLFISCFFCCCLHWQTLQPLLPCSAFHQPPPQILHKPPFPVLMMKERRAESLPVVMPGDKVPKFIAMACPCQPHTNERITVHVQKPC